MIGFGGERLGVHDLVPDSLCWRVDGIPSRGRLIGPGVSSWCEYWWQMTEVFLGVDYVRNLKLFFAVQVTWLCAFWK